MAETPAALPVLEILLVVGLGLPESSGRGNLRGNGTLGAAGLLLACP